ncbi:hypothetical protein DH2020_023266 [Rehmannia glutinosa]|uniref:2'-phosphotransferase n=1 Tax=Rehmannia glutinosa TaxID=99300 RepID=A0ABR0W5I1_REHGL
MWVSFTSVGLRILCNRLVALPIILVDAPSLLNSRLRNSRFMESRHNYTTGSSSFTASAYSNRSGGRGRGLGMKDNRERSRGSGNSSSGNDKIDALGRLLTRVLRHMASELKLDMRSDGYVKVQALLKLNLKTFANIPLRSHTIDEVREAVRRDNKQRFSILEENGELRYGQIKATLYSLRAWDLQEKLGINSRGGSQAHEEITCAFLLWLADRWRSMRRDVNVLIFLDVRKALEEGMRLYISDNRVILTEGFDGVVPVKYFQKIESWPKREPIPF